MQYAINKHISGQWLVKGAENMHFSRIYLGYYYNILDTMLITDYTNLNCSKLEGGVPENLGEQIIAHYWPS